MLTKILVTLLVIVVAMMSMKKRQPQEKQQYSQPPSMASTWLKFLAPAIAGAVLLAAAAYSGWQWWQGQQLLEVRVHDANSQQTQQYQVYRKDLDGRRFTTKEGLYVELGASDRLEISELK
ncbi:hypothetical protein [Ferrimonas aestuarii]|uniref:Uncharacterized protein n=1 Tax=Ferrimonas aestuarii TaxID=2569539 RepID=A0A4U1BNI2_9GAMM|nr:hypothetical protein [Ferrimonas aestuarii]TKB51659.1 hypothetical protein FCL42_17605 [Ferrimonas aestuarii]